jgi:hypothetical protein
MAKRNKMKAYWNRMTATERKAEMQRRVAKRARTLKQKGTAVSVHHIHRQEGQAAGPPSLESHVAYLAGKCETTIERYAISNSIPYAPLAAGVSAVLRHSAGG